MKIGLFGGTFDPITNGHMAIAKHALKHLGLDKLIFIPTFINPFKTKIKPVDAIHRYNMIKLVLQKNMEVSDFEINRKGPSYTIETLKYFKNKYPNDQLYFLIGSDNLSSIDKWQGVEEFKNLAQVVCYKRTKYIKRYNAKKYNIKIMDNELFNFSSTEYREGKMKTINPKVQKYIGHYYLYIDAILKNTLSHDRYMHSKHAAEFAAELAKHLNYPIKKAYYAGLMHDITKEWTISQHRAFLQKNNIDDSNVEDYELHQLTAEVFLKNVYKIEDLEILRAIKYHTTLTCHVNTLGKIIYVADKICKGRAWDGIQNYRKMCFKDFDKAFKDLVLKIWQHYAINNYDISDKQEKIYILNTK